MLWYRYSSEVAGTIIVQCIPILRPFLRNTLTLRFGSVVDRSSAFGTRPNAQFGSRLTVKRPAGAEKDRGKGSSEKLTWKEFPLEPPDSSWKGGSYSPSTMADAELGFPPSTRIRYESGKSLGSEGDRTSHAPSDADRNLGPGLSPPPPLRW